MSDHAQLEPLGEHLRTWCMEAFPERERLRIAGFRRPTGTGVSGSVLFVTVTWELGGEKHVEDLVARLPSGFLNGQGDHGLSIGGQARLMTLLRSENLPVPRVLHVGTGGSHVRIPFLVMECLPGRPAADVPPYTVTGWVARASPRQRRELELRAFALLARLHRIALPGPPATPPELPASDPLCDLERISVDALVEFAQRAPKGTSLHPLNPSLRPVLVDWLEANPPDGRFEPSINWGDARLGNYLFDMTGVPTGMLDWEMAFLGPSECDVAWFLFLRRLFLALATEFRRAPLGGFADRTELLDMHAGIVGRPVRNLEWFEGLAALKFLFLMHRVVDRLESFGTEGPSAVRSAVEHVTLEIVGR